MTIQVRTVPGKREYDAIKGRLIHETWCWLVSSWPLRALRCLCFWVPWAVGVVVLLAMALVPTPASYERTYCSGDDLVLERFNGRTGALSIGVDRGGCNDRGV